MMTTVPRSLARARALIDEPLRGRIEQLPDDLRRVIAYHFGFTDANGLPATGESGKALRPALASLSAEAAGGSSQTAVPGAVAVELVHNFSLLHDDVMDQDRERRHRPTAWALFGVGQAIVAGDALLALAQQVLLEAGGDRGVRAAAELTAATGRMIAGQSMDLAFESRLDVSIEECMDMLARKTGALLSCSACIGAILAGGEEGMIRALREYGLNLGLAFQAVDDILGIWGHPEATGKPAGSDIRQHKKTLPVVAALAAGTPPADRLASLLQAGRLEDPDVELAVRLVEEAGGRARAAREADLRTEQAVASLRDVPMDPVARDELVEIARFVTEREF
jgi:geranylgeranyl diphosphate synthase, type I